MEDTIWLLEKEKTMLVYIHYFIFLSGTSLMISLWKKFTTQTFLNKMMLMFYFMKKSDCLIKI